MGLWNYGRKGTHDREASSSSGRCHGSVKEEAASHCARSRLPSPSLLGPPAIATGSTSALRYAGATGRRRRRSRGAMSTCPTRGISLPTASLSRRCRREAVRAARRSSAAAALLPDDLYYDPRCAADSTLWDTWLRDDYEVLRASYFAKTVAGPRQAREVRGRTRVRGLTPTPSPSSSLTPPPPPRMTEEEEARLMQRVMEDSMTTHDERQWSGLDRTMALSAAGDVAIPEPMKEEVVAVFPPNWWARCGAGRTPRRRWRGQWGP
ncbi:hypothetical protein D1007_30381 [Hordeum vulgare]|nr:hypothetical protein D1007_30381 [Hordeum vulgare]